MLLRLALIAVAILAGWGALANADAARDYYLSWQITQSLRQWDEARQVDSDRRLADHIETIESLVRKHPSDPGLRFTAVKLYEWQAHLQRYSPRHQKETLEHAEAHVYQAILSRPLWGRAWAAWLDLGSRIDPDWRPELEYRLDTALKLGRYDLHTQQYLAPFTNREWTRLPANVQQKLEFLKK